MKDDDEMSTTTTKSNIIEMTPPDFEKIESSTKPTIQARRIETQQLITALMSLEQGERISYDDLSQVIQRDVRGVPHLLSAARRECARQGTQIDCIRAWGMINATDRERADASGHIRALKRAATRGRQRVHSVVDFDALPPEAKIRQQAHAAVLGAIESVAKSSSLKRISKIAEADKAAKISQEDVIRSTLAAFSGKPRVVGTIASKSQGNDKGETK